MTDYFVTTAEDELFDGGTFFDEMTDGAGLSLREAIGLAGLSNPGGGATVLFEGGGFFALQHGALEVVTSMDIIGQAGMVIDGSGNDRVMHVGDGARLLMQNVTLTGGNAFGGSGGGLLADGGAVVELIDVEVSGNFAAQNGGGLSVQGGADLNMSNVTIRYNAAGGLGGGLMVDAGARASALSQSAVITDNQAGQSGGGVHVGGDVTLDGVEIGRNSASQGGGIEVAGGLLVLTNATVHGNMAGGDGGGIHAVAGGIEINGATLTGNAAGGGGGGLFAGAGAAVANSIIAGNAAGNGEDVTLSGAGGIFDGANVVGQSGGGLGASVTVLADEGLALSDLFAVLDGGTGGGLAADHGGFGATVALAVSGLNPALGTADPGFHLPLDGRGAPRDPATADLGAYEEAINPDAPSLVVTTFDDVVDAFDGLTSLREAVGWANDGTLAGTITFDSNGRAVLRDGALVITGTVAIDGEGALDALGASRVFEVESGGHLQLLGGLSITGGATAGDGGGALVNLGGRLDLSGAVFFGNVAGGDGGGLATHGIVDAVDGAFLNNTATGGGGVAAAAGGAFIGTGVDFAGNAADSGGGILAGGEVTLGAGTISANTATRGGGVQVAASGSFTAADLTVTANTAAIFGGGIYNLGDTALTRTTITANDGGQSGGGAATIGSGQFSGRDVVIADNIVTNAGGGIYALLSNLDLANAEIGGNRSAFGAGIYAYQSGGDIVNATLHGNHALLTGGGMLARGAAPDMSFSTITGNSADAGGGVALLGGAGAQLSNSIVAGNSARTTGADLAAEAAPTGLTTVLLGETATLLDGAALALDPGDAQVLADLGLTPGSVFAGISGYGGTVAANGGFGRTAALSPSSVNPATGGAIGGRDVLDLDGGGVTDEPLPWDARGVARPAEGGDLGAYEAPGTDIPSLRVTTMLDIVNDSDTLNSLREAMAWAATGGAGGAITFSQSAVLSQGGTLVLTGGELVIDAAMSIDGDVDGDGVADVTLDAGEASRVMRVTAGGDAQLSALVLTGGYTFGLGGGALVEGAAALSLDRVVVTGNQARHGGGVDVVGGSTLYARDSAFTDNVATSKGGGITSYGATDLVNVEIARNTAGVLGGGLYARYGGEGAALSVENATVHSNAAEFLGGGMSVNALSTMQVVISASTITGNRVEHGASSGGGLRLANGGDDVTIANTLIAGNAAPLGDDLSIGQFGTPTLSGVILGQEAHQDAAPADLGAGVLVLATSGLGAADVFAAIDPLTGGGQAADNGGPVDTVALAAVAGNAALGTAGPATPDAHDLDGDGDVSEAQPLDARGEARGLTPDVGAYEAPPTDAPSLIVTTTADTINDSDGEISLREAIGWAADGTLTGAITFDAGVFGAGATIVLNGAELLLSGVIDIDGDVDGDDVADVTISAAGLSRVATADLGADVRLSHLVLRDGQAGVMNGGGLSVLQGASVELDRVTVADNAADLGGGIHVEFGSTLMARDLAASGNTAQLGGGGLASRGVSTVINAAFSGNMAVESAGGGVLAYGFGALTMVNATLHGNTVQDGHGGGLFVGQSSAVLDHVTITGNTAWEAGGLGVFTSSQVAITNSIIAANAGGGGELEVDLSSVADFDAAGVALGTAAMLGNGGGEAFAAPGLTVVDAGDLFGAYEGGVPVLADNGGPVQTVALSHHATNPALSAAFPVFGAGIDGDGDGAVEFTLSVDARGAARGWVSDLGAYEAPMALLPSLAVTTLEDVVDASDGEVSLREAIAWVESGALTGTITFDLDAAGTVHLQGSEIVISGRVAIDGAVGAGHVTLNGSGAGRILRVADGGDAALGNMTLSGGHASGDGGAVLIEAGGALDLAQARVLGSLAGGDGGGIFVSAGASLTGRDLEVAGNDTRDSDGRGGGIALQGDATLANVALRGNLAGYGGGIDVSGDGALRLVNATLAENTALKEGGGLQVGGILSSHVFFAFGGASADLDFVTITGNHAGGASGGIGVATSTGEARIANSIVAGNSSGFGLGDDMAYRRAADGEGPSFVGKVVTGTELYALDLAAAVPGDQADLHVLAHDGQTAADVFAAIDPSTGGGLMADNGGFAATVALAATRANPALDAALQTPFADLPDADGNGLLDEFLVVDARGAARGPSADIGAYEVHLEAPSLVVTTAFDLVDATDGLTSLREAIAHVESGLISGTITFASGAGEAFEGGGDVFLSGQELLITGHVAIDGDVDGDGEGDVTLDAALRSRIVHVEGGDADLHGLSFRYGLIGLIPADADEYGAAILVDEGGALTLSAGAVHLNRQGQPGALDGGGGAVAVMEGSHLDARDVAFHDNFAAHGGALYVAGAAHVVNSEFSSNDASGGHGGAIYADGGTLKLVNATLHANSAAVGGGGIFLSDASATIDHATIVANEAGFAGGGISTFQSALTVSNSIIAGNAGSLTVSDDMDGDNAAGMRIDASLLGTAVFDVSTGAAMAYGGQGAQVLADLGIDLDRVFAEMDEDGAPVLADNGGPVRTVALAELRANPALAAGVQGAEILDANGNGVLDLRVGVDARGAARGPGAADLGAFEAAPLDIPALLVTTLEDRIDDSDGDVSLREALGWINDGTLTGDITFLTGGTIYLAHGALELSGDVTINGDLNGDGAPEVVLDAGGLSRVVNVAAGADAALSGLVVTGGLTDGPGGGIAVETGAALALSGVAVTGNASAGGGGIFVAEGATLEGVDLAITGNDAGAGYGGGLLSRGASVLVNVEIGDNAAKIGGGVFADAGRAELTNATVHGNVAEAGGGVATIGAGEAALLSSTVTGNSAASGPGGGLLLGGAAGWSVNSIVAGNTAAYGADAALMDGHWDLSTGTILGTAALAGGPVALNAPLVLDAAGIALGDVFAGLDGATGGGLAAQNGGLGRTVALTLDPSNPALGGADAGAPPPDRADLDGDGDVAEPLPQGANGVARDWPGADVGAFEAPDLDVMSLVVTTMADAVDANDGVISLREAIGWVNEGALSGTITFDAGVFGGSGVIALNGTELLITADMAIDGDIDGDGFGDVHLAAGGASRALHVDGAAAVLTGLSITGGLADRGAGLLIEGASQVDLNGVALSGNNGADAGSRGGGILVSGPGTLAMTGGVIASNAAHHGGGLAIEGGASATLSGVLVSENQALRGGGIYGAEGAQLLAVNTTLVENYGLDGGGGALFAAGASAVFDHATVTGNFAEDYGIAFLLEGEGDDAAALTLRDSIVVGNLDFPIAEIYSADAGGIRLEGGVLLAADPTGDIGAAVRAPGATPVLLSDRPDLDMSDVFFALDELSGGGEYFFEPGLFVGVPLAPTFTNPALDAGGPDGGVDALGAPRAAAFLDPLGPDLSDLGAVEMRRLPLPDAVGALPQGLPVLGDLGAVAADLSGAAAEFNGAAFVNMGADDRLRFADATSAAQFSFDGTLLSYDADGDGRAEAQTWLGVDDGLALSFTEGPGGVTVGLAPALRAIGEVTELTVGTSWLTLDFANEYIDPVVFALAPSLNEADAAATRFKNITGAGAEIRLQETKKIIDPETGLQINNPGDHADETVTLLVLEKGVHTLEDGTVIQVGELSTSKLYVKGFEDVAFAENFETTPAIFSQVQGVNGTDFIISRQRNPDQSGFQLTMQEEQADNRNHAAEDVGWFAIEHGGGTLSGMAWQAGSSSQNVNGKLTQVMFDAAFDEAPLVVASLASYNGTDTSSPRIGSVTATRFHAAAIEDTSYDLETNHGYEIVDWMAFSAAGSIFAAPEAPALALAQAGPETRVAETGFAQAGDVAVTVSFGAAFDNPVVIASLISAHDGGAAVARVTNVTATGFDVAVQEAGDQDGAHGVEDISWIVVEAGSWQLAGGTMLQAGLADLGATARQGFTELGFDASFAAGPAVLTQTQTANDADFVKTRMQDIDADGFSVGLEEEEAASWGAHGAETVGWLALDMGAASDGFEFAAGSTRATHDAVDVALSGALGMVAGAASFNGPDAAAARIDMTADGFAVHIEEDLSLNPETTHRPEDIHWLAWSGAGDIWGDAIG